MVGLIYDAHIEAVDYKSFENMQKHICMINVKVRCEEFVCNSKVHCGFLQHCKEPTV